MKKLTLKEDIKEFQGKELSLREKREHINKTADLRARNRTGPTGEAYRNGFSSGYSSGTIDVINLALNELCNNCTNQGKCKSNIQCQFNSTFRQKLKKYLY
jgi:hypothetical protein